MTVQRPEPVEATVTIEMGMTEAKIPRTLLYHTRGSVGMNRLFNELTHAGIEQYPNANDVVCIGDAGIGSGRYIYLELVANGK